MLGTSSIKCFRLQSLYYYIYSNKHETSLLLLVLCGSDINNTSSLLTPFWKQRQQSRKQTWKQRQHDVPLEIIVMTTVMAPWQHMLVALRDLNKPFPLLGPCGATTRDSNTGNVPSLMCKCVYIFLNALRSNHLFFCRQRSISYVMLCILREIYMSKV